MKRTLATLAVLVATSSAFACPMCKDSVPNKENAPTLLDSSANESRNISGGINTSIFVMLGGLLGVLGIVSTVIIKGIKTTPHK